VSASTSANVASISVILAQLISLLKPPTETITVAPPRGRLVRLNDEIQVGGTKGRPYRGSGDLPSSEAPHRRPVARSHSRKSRRVTLAAQQTLSAAP